MSKSFFAIGTDQDSLNTCSLWLRHPPLVQEQIVGHPGVVLDGNSGCFKLAARNQRPPGCITTAKQHLENPLLVYYETPVADQIFESQLLKPVAARTEHTRCTLARLRCECLGCESATKYYLL